MMAVAAEQKDTKMTEQITEIDDQRIAATPEDRGELHPRILERLKILGEWHGEIVGLGPAVVVCENAQEQFEDIGSFFICATGSEITVYATVENLFEDVVPMLRYFAKQGYRQTKTMFANTEGESFTWYLGKIVLQVSITGTICRRVKVGEEKLPARVVSIYEFRCGDSEKSVVDELQSLDPVIEAAVDGLAQEVCA